MRAHHVDEMNRMTDRYTCDIIHGVHLSGLSGRSQDLRLWGMLCQDCQDMRGKMMKNLENQDILGFLFQVSGLCQDILINFFLFRVFGSGPFPT